MRTIILVVLVAVLAAEERFPPPDFSPGYVIPATTVPAPRAEWLALLDLGLLAFALALAGWAVLGRRSRRAAVWVALGSLAWFGFVRQGCVCPIGAIQDVARAAVAGGGLSWVAAGFFVLPLATALIAGRLFCSGVCPLGAAQDLVLIHPLRLPAWLTGLLGLLPGVYLALAVVWAGSGAAYIICAYDPFVGFFRLDGPAWLLIAGGGLLLIATVVGRPYCRFLCPYGVLLRWLSPLARWGVRIHPGTCTNCRLCEASCPYDAIAAPVPATAPRPSRALLGGLLLAAPLLAVLGGWLGWRAGDALAGRHPAVALAERLAAEAAGTATGVDDAAESFRRTGRGEETAHAAADAVRQRTRWLAAGAGACLGLGLGVGLIRRSRRPRRTLYEAEAGACVACARCLPDCPGETPAVAP